MGKEVSTLLPHGCNLFNEEDEKDEFYHHIEAKILSEQEYNKYFGKDKVETDIIESDYYDTDEESEEEYELFRKMSIKQKERKKQVITQNKIDRIAFINQFDKDI